MAPQQLVEPQGGIVQHTFSRGENIYKIAKYCICRFRAKVPNYREVNSYVDEVISLHNMTRLPNEPRINGGYIPTGVTVDFYPPLKYCSLRRGKELSGVGLDKALSKTINPTA